MTPSRAAARARALTACVTLAALLAGCATLRWERGPYPDTVAGRTFSHAIVTVTDADGHPRDLELHRVAVTSDSVVGFPEKTNLPDRIAIPFADVQRIRTWHTNGWTTALAVVGGTAFLVLGVAGLACIATSCVKPSWGSQ